MKSINISGEIGWDVMPSDIQLQLNAAKGDDLEINIASPGGYVFDGIEIYNAIRDYKRKYPDAQIIGNLRGIVASMGSYLAVNPAIDLLTAEDNAVFMIHNVWGVALGDYREMMKTAEIFEGLTDILSDAYMNKTGQDKKTVRDLMDAESWYFGSEIKDNGFCDEIIGGCDGDKEKDAVIISAKAQIKMLSEKMREQPENQDRIAACLKPEQTAQPTAKKHVVANIIPAQRENTEAISMKLNELLDQNPAAKMEHKDVLKAQFDAGRQSLQATITGAAKYLRPDCQYPAVIKSLAVDVLDGKKSLEALETTVAAFDAMQEANKSAVAQTESAELPANGSHEPGTSADGENKTESDYQAMIAADKAALGMGV